MNCYPRKCCRLKFSRWTSLTQKSDTFGSLMNELQTIRSGEFEVTNLSATLLFILPFGKITANESALVPYFFSAEVFIYIYKRVFISNKSDTVYLYHLRDRPEMMRSIIRFEIKFRRIVYYYSATIALPLFCLATLVFLFPMGFPHYLLYSIILFYFSRSH